MFSLFSYLRRKTAEAVLGGVDDALDALGADDTGAVTVEIPEALRLRLATIPDTDTTDGKKAVRKRGG